jgi:hypothetical protein
MGKIKSQRARKHLKAVPLSKEAASVEDSADEAHEEDTIEEQDEGIETAKVKTGLFKIVCISVTYTMPFFYHLPARPHVQTTGPVHLDKKSKRNLRHKAWLESRAQLCAVR